MSFTPPIRRVTVAPVSHEIVKLGVVSFVTSSVEEEPVSDAVVRSGVPGADGVDESIVIERDGEEVLAFPARSVNVEVMVWEPDPRTETVIV